MGKEEEIRKSLGDFAARFGPAATMIGTVKSVNESELTCVLADDDFEIPDVRLRPVLDDKDTGIIIFPKPGTWCLAIRLENSEEWMLIAASEIGKYRIKQNDLVFEMDGTQVLIEKEGANLLDIIKSICEACLQIVVIQGNNPDYQKLTDALAKAQLLLK